jgi:hypothetical protein
LIWDQNNPMAPPRRVLKPESIRRECRDSLRRLGVERIDLYQFHWPDETGTPVEDSWREMVRLKSPAIALPHRLPHEPNAPSRFLVFVAKFLKGLVGAPGLEPGTR